MRSVRSTQVRELRDVVVNGRVLNLESDRAIYSHDLGYIPASLKGLLFRAVPICVVQPASEGELIEVIRYCRTHGIPVVTRTAASSGFGNVIPTAAEVVIDLSCLDTIVAFDPAVPSIAVQAGARWADVDAFLSERGYSVHTYPSSYYSSVGGWIATGGLGINSLRFGHLRNHVLSMRVIFPDGDVLELTPSDPWFDRFFGTEGQLGLVVQVSLRVRQKPERTFPLLLSFEGEGDAFHWMHAAMGNGTSCNHLKFMGAPLIAEMNRFYGESLVEPKPSVLAVFEEDGARNNMPRGPGREVPEYLARFLWHERLFPLRMHRAGSSLLASETLFEDSAAVRYVARIHSLAACLGFEVLVEAHAVEPHRLLLMPHFLAEPDRPARYMVALMLTSMLTQTAVDQGGVPYGLGIWNSPFIRSKFDVPSLNALGELKDEVDPDHLFNPCRYFRVKTRFLNIPGQAFRPWVFGFLMRALSVTSPCWGWVARILTSDKTTRSRSLAPMERAALLCSHCGSCLSVCPAYRVTKDEALTARSKLRLIRRLLTQEAISPVEAEKVFMCLHCHACERVCQSRLGLVDAWEELETSVAGKHGTPSDAVADFMKDVGESDEYKRMVDNW